MNGVRIAPIVEGHGDGLAVPILIRRIALTIEAGFVPLVLRPIRIPANRLVKQGEVERTVELAARRVAGNGGILILVDCDGDGGCPARDGPPLLDRAISVRRDVPIAVVLAKKEFEAWFLAAAESLRGVRGLPLDLASPDNPEEIRGAKEWLGARMPRNRRYSETEDQPAFTDVFDMDAARRADSFDKCFREIRRMLVTLRQPPTHQ
jgi:hypothetical protein